jgi:outer membrane receptor protein involved in Fe transport
MSRGLACFVTLLLLLAAGGSGRALGQSPESGDRETDAPPESLHRLATARDSVAYLLPPILVRADKHEKSIDGFAGAIDVLSDENLTRPATASLAEVIGATPGIYVYDRNGSRGRPAIDVRGFTGQGDSEYLQVMMNGVPLNGAEAGLVEWLLIDRELLQTVEVVRGPASALYGDAALGGLVNVETDLPENEGRGGGLSAEGGSFGEVRFRGRLHGAKEGLRAGAWAWRQRVDGWRDHSAYDGWHGLATAEKDWSTTSRLSLNALFADLDRDEPGPVPETATDEQREAASTPFDQTSDRHLLLSAQQQWGIGSRRSLGLLSYFRYLDGEETRTIIETKEKVTRERSLGVEARSFSTLPFRRSGRALNLALGLELERGHLTSDYYGAPGGVRGDLTAEGKDVRWDQAAYFLLEVPLASRWELQLGTRFDRIVADFDDRDSTSVNRTMSSVSPKFAVNHRLPSGGNAYLSLTRGFKAPTLEQLFDQRRPLGLDLANSDLDPQHATNLEIGIRHRYGPVPFALSLYNTWVRDEIGFDLESFTLLNIGESIHRGLEARFGPARRGPFALDLGYTYLDAQFDAGPDDGKQINNTPRHVITGNLRYDRWARWTLVGRSVHRIFLDEANEHPLRGFTVFDLEIERPLGPTSWSVAVRNLFDHEYAGTGYIDAFGQAVVFPAAGRNATAGMRFDY